MIEKKANNYVQWLQLLVLVFGVTGFFVDIGKKTEILNKTSSDLYELKGIVQDLVKSQITVAVNDSKHSILLDDLRARVSNLEYRTTPHAP